MNVYKPTPTIEKVKKALEFNKIHLREVVSTGTGHANRPKSIRICAMSIQEANISIDFSQSFADPQHQRIETAGSTTIFHAPVQSPADCRFFQPMRMIRQYTTHL